MAGTLLDHLRDFLIAEGIARDPRTPGPLPPVWRQPRNGCPAPGEGDEPEVGADAVLALMTAPGVPPRRYEGALRRDGVDVWVRAAAAPTAFAIEQRLRAVLNDRRAFDLAGLRLEECLLFRDLQLIESGEQGFTFTTGYLFERWA
jgi:hypothetical protein